LGSFFQHRVLGFEAQNTCPAPSVPQKTPSLRPLPLKTPARPTGFVFSNSATAVHTRRCWVRFFNTAFLASKRKDPSSTEPSRKPHPTSPSCLPAFLPGGKAVLLTAPPAAGLFATLIVLPAANLTGHRPYK
jgi:hypothetical protein